MALGLRTVFPQGTRGLGAALQEASPLLLGLAQGLRQNAPEAGIQQGLAAMMKKQQEREGQDIFDSIFNGGNATLSTSGQRQPSGYVPPVVDGGGAFPASLIQSESGGNWNALNNVTGAGGIAGHGGRLQFGGARLQDAARAGIINAMSPQEFAQASPEVQQAVERWHFSDIDRQAQERGLTRYVGQNVGGVPVTQDAIRSMAHLGGIGGAERFLESGGRYNPADANGTSLSDYGQRHGGGNVTMSTSGQQGPSLDRLYAALGSGRLNPQQAAVVQAMIASQQQQNDPLRQIQFQTAQAQLEQLRNPQPEQTDRMANYQFLLQQGFSENEAIERAFGGNGTNVNVNTGAEVGSIPAGYELFTDQTTGARSMRPIPGGPAAAELAAAEAAAAKAQTTQGKAEDRQAIATNVLGEAAGIARSIADDSGRLSTGIFGAGLSFNPESNAAELRRQVDVLKANATIENLNAMRQASPTGGALGSVTEKEGAMLASASGALDPNSSPEQFARQLDNYERTLYRVVLGEQRGNEEWSRVQDERRTQRQQPRQPSQPEAPNAGNTTLPPTQQPNPANGQPMAPPTPGTRMGDYVFKGGNPNDQSNWELAR